MRTLTIFAGALFLCVTIMSFLFKIMHWKGADLGLLIGMSGLALIFVPLLAKLLTSKKT